MSKSLLSPIRWCCIQCLFCQRGKKTKENINVLELAATADWLAKEEKILKWRDEIKKRKGWKTNGGRLEKALNLLVALELSPIG
jgi:wyosine [tRNA(Phe)-imidazoG37] synthetase (radical SAM superfamily)